MLISSPVQQYAWGKTGRSSEVAKIKMTSDSDFLLKRTEPYAELWMGTHPSGPAKLTRDGTMLADYLKINEDVVGDVPEGYPSNDLPFLFKVLSIQTALSIQAHPDKKLAEELHMKFPEIYKDGNHKPEMAIALTRFEALCGFRSISEIKRNVAEYPELKAILGAVVDKLNGVDDNSPDDIKRAALRDLLVTFMTSDNELSRQQIELLIDRISKKLRPASLNGVHHINSDDSKPSSPKKATSISNVDDLMLRLYFDFPGDRGILAPLILNYFTLEPGQGFFMGPNEPHAYISGDCVECMALSDNVVRAGLTPKFKDVETLCQMLHYGCGPPELIEPEHIEPFTNRYRPPPDICKEFEVEVTKVPFGDSLKQSIVLPARSCASLLLLLKGVDCTITFNATQSDPGSEGEGDVVREIDGMRVVTRKVPQGAVVLQGAGQTLSLSLSEEDSLEGLVVYRAHMNLGV